MTTNPHRSGKPVATDDGNGEYFQYNENLRRHFATGWKISTGIVAISK